MNLVIRVPWHVTAVWHLAVLQFVVFVLMRFLVGVECGAVRYDYRDLRMDHGGCGVITIFRALSQVAATIMALISLSMDVYLTLQPPIWRIDALLLWTGRPYVRAIVVFHILLMMVGSMNYLLLRSRRISARPLTNFPSSDARYGRLPLSRRRIGLVCHR